MQPLDWIITLGALVLMIGVSVRSRPTPSENADRFTGGRALPAYLLGGSLAATTLSTDTPSLVTGAFYANGLSGNLFWLATLPGFMATMFFFAKYWRRSGVITELEILPLRYGDTPTINSLRISRALLEGLVINVLILSSVMLGAKLILEGLLGAPRSAAFSFAGFSLAWSDLILIGLVALTVAYTALAGFAAVVRTDLIQMIAAIALSILLLIFGLQSAVNDFGSLEDVFSAIPDRAENFRLFDPDDSSWILLIAVGWWSLPGNGLVVQRLVSARSERDATAMLLWFSVIHFFVRAWPWFIIGALALVYFPDLDHNEEAFTAMAAEFLPTGMVGLTAAALLSAFMSTVDSRLNWGASYVVRDALRLEGASQARKAQLAERMTVAGLALAALILTVSGAFDSIIGIYTYLMVIQAGGAFTAAARWYWWRLTDRAELASFVASLIFGNILYVWLGTDEPARLAMAIAANALGCAALAAGLSVLQPLSSQCASSAAAFHTITRVGGPGWSRFQGGMHDEKTRPGLLETASYWLVTTILLYASLAVIAALAAGDMAVFLTALMTGLVALLTLMARRQRLSACLSG